MNALGIIGLIWGCLKMIVGNETVNVALDNWTKGTSNTVDDAVWKLLEQAAGVADHAAKAAMLEDGLKAIEAEYVTAKQAGKLANIKRPTKTWAVPMGSDEIRALLTGETVTSEV